MIELVLVGAALGGCLFWLIATLVPARHSPLVELARFDAHRRAQEQPDQVGQGSAGQDPAARTKLAATVQGRLGRRFATGLQRRGIRYTGLRQDLVLTGQSFDTLMGRKVVAAAGGFGLTVLVLAWLQYARGAHLPPGAPIIVALVIAAALFIAPDLDVHKQAKRRRAEFSEALSVYLEVVFLEMVGNAAAETALPVAARRGGTWSTLLIRETLVRARLRGEDAWEALADLGRRIGVAELRELGNLIKNVADDGAQVRQTLSARAASLRRARLAAEEGAAEERNQSMRLAQLLIAFGFMLFVGWPAFVNIHF